MSTTALVRPTPLPTIKRLGFYDGWAAFEPTFLNFGCPSIFVDSCYLPEAESLGFEPFGTRPARDPLPEVAIRVRTDGPVITLSSASGNNLIAIHQMPLPQIATLVRARQVIILVGGSWELSLSWSVLWDCRIGRATTSRAAPAHAPPLVWPSPPPALHDGRGSCSY